MNLLSDLVVLVADKNMEASVQGLLGRCSALHIRPIRWKIFVHPERDPGCLKRGHEFLRPMSRDYTHALIVFDNVGCGQESRSTDELESIVNGHLSRSGWEARAGAVVIRPELEAWVWADSHEVGRCLGWGADTQELREWISDKGFWPDDKAKPNDPKAALDLTLRKLKRPRSSSIYRQLAQTISFQQCMDPAFLRFRTLLQTWFSQEDAAGHLPN